jgi:methionine-rich copper-binding protein CopC
MRLSLVFASMLAVSAGPAYAHAMLMHAEPAAGQTSSTQTVVLQFSEALEPKFSSIAVYYGDRPVRGQMQFGKMTMIFLITERPLVPGTYEVRWRALSVDGHVTQGAYQFTFAAIP